ncbi:MULTISPECIES: YbaB/EbfC family nucleoid-associated protein [unclassified Wenzhouxiangella]|uniref:YbaB/EbfC family nucleoid-associated protein n=1 Tax=unclassified Wenzhouxiangella TaxID=2613841 RepID=UPI000E325F94|nr:MULTISPECIES: YbaB/EbfC family nucleoid-associated protein [unclassified Wenzhouxiangella]RFF26752.1 YbaB/EbfC family nucleoid-associated protein [Wenzhouxiangella sp. 15181]RFP68916.1 YbaB/EbfC family nucleoid-associated protein [Wenzhouxiangella sp. 15190]
MKGNISQLMQQAQKVQEDLKKAQEELAELEVIGESGGGLVKVEMNGRHEVRRVSIDPEVADDREMVEDLMAAAINDAVKRIQETTKERMSGLTGGLPMPPGFNL